jgi:hypothetical protein
VLACDTPAALKQLLQKDAIFHVTTTPLEVSPLGWRRSVRAVHAGDGRARSSLILKPTKPCLVLTALNARGIRLLNLKSTSRRWKMFMQLTGRSLSEESVEAAG